MSKNLSDTRLQVWHVETSQLVRRFKDSNQPIMREVNIREVNNALEELLRRRKLIGAGYKKRNDITEWMINAKVGDRSVWPEIGQGRLNTYRRTARTALGNPEARWTAMTVGSTSELERIADGLDANTFRHRSFIIGVMVEMNVNGRVTVPNPYKGQRIPHKNKVIARQLMDNPDADWRYKNLSKHKTRITRIK